MSETTTSNNNNNSCSRTWTRTLQSFTKPVLQPFVWLAHHAATHPKLYIVGTIVLSLGVMVLGLATNFTAETDDDIWTPQGSKSLEHGEWVDDKSGFPVDSRTAVLVLHRDGKSLFGDIAGDDNSLALESTRRMFEAMDVVRNTPRYDELCALSNYTHPYTGETDCQIVGASTFWNDSTAIWQEQATSDEVVLQTMSADRYPYGGVVDHDQIIGYNVFDEQTGILNNGLSYVVVIFLPPDKEDVDDSEAFSKDFEKDAIDNILDLQDVWAAEDGNDFKIEILSDRSFEDEFGRALTGDLPLLPSVFLVMSVLCILLFSRRDPVLSRGWLGFGAVVTVLLAIMASFGLLFLIGVPFTSLTPLLPFIMFGVGLDDAFIISGAFARTDHRKSPVERIDDTMHEIGGTILLTTLTSSLAFALGAISSIPAVRYLVMYAFPTIVIDFMFQITFFVAIIVLDQRRIEQNRRDCCFCCKAKDVSQASQNDLQGKPDKHFADRLMSGYADVLLKPSMKWIVIAIFTAMLAFFSWRTSLLKQYFDFTDVIPSDSYIQTWWTGYQDYYEANGVRAGVYFRDVDFSDAAVRDQMETYVQELAAMPAAGANEPFSFWLRDFNEFVASKDELATLSFEDQIKLFLEDPVYFDSHHEDIVLNEEGVMTASRTLIRLNNVDEEDVVEVVDVLELQRSISANQPINQDKDNWAFFTFTEDYYIWEFYRVSPDELRLTTIIGVVSVSVLALLFIPHWTAVLFVGPLVAILYIDLLGFIQLCGIHVNPVMYISTVMSIGLMVDFVMHVTLMYVETTGHTSRTAKTKETLETIGASVLLGGISTLIGVLPLALSQSEIFWTTFVIFFGLVLFGLLHGLILLPVLLAMLGPLDSINDDGEEPMKNHHKTLETQETASQTRGDSGGDDSAGIEDIQPEMDDISVESAAESIEV